ncbi:hypothetical protein BDZ97DRAFT_2045781, partial [Flammula alnicola]
MYINLPSKNHYRRRASYMSKGYHTRHMAGLVIPLITNVKNAEMLAEELIRRLPLDVSSLDLKSSHRTRTFPGWSTSELPSLALTGSKDLASAMEASISAGFTTALILPFGDENSIVYRHSRGRSRG